MKQTRLTRMGRLPHGEGRRKPSGRKSHHFISSLKFLNSASFQLSFICADYNTIRSFLLALQFLITLATARAWQDFISPSRFLAGSSSFTKRLNLKRITGSVGVLSPHAH
ncbi:hypothetical protein CDAR_101711 [Caerostris darwini]|uniref:Uncharacterized protein n=1 Tax=Caerostris darwini TaxID=1538125 RepID=A0AAV4S6R1_9ARAC|nr:hypothetical protein CDAR_101711 [Caerostris darwini]